MNTSERCDKCGYSKDPRAGLGRCFCTPPPLKLTVAMSDPPGVIKWSGIEIPIPIGYVELSRGQTITVLDLWYEPMNGKWEAFHLGSNSSNSAVGQTYGVDSTCPIVRKIR